jgi:hypothetical protein
MKETRKAREENGKTTDVREANKKKTYVKPSFECESVFETMALACGKVSPTQAQCRFNRKNS